MTAPTHLSDPPTSQGHMPVHLAAPCTSISNNARRLSGPSEPSVRGCAGERLIALTYSIADAAKAHGASRRRSPHLSSRGFDPSRLLDTQSESPLTLLAATELMWLQTTRDEALHTEGASDTCKTSPVLFEQRRCRTQDCSHRCRLNTQRADFLPPFQLKIERVELRH